MTLTPAFVLHTRSYKNNSLLVDLLTQDDGRICVVAKGVRSGKKLSSATLQPFRPLIVGYQGRSDLKTLTHGELAHRAIQLNGMALYCGLYVNELLIRLLKPLAPVPEIYLGYRQVIHSLGDSSIPQAPVLRVFEFNLLTFLGYGLVLDKDARTGMPIQANTYYQFVNQMGLVKAKEPPLPANSTHLLKGEHILAWLNGDYNKYSLSTIKTLTHQALDAVLEGKTLNSREFFKS